MNKEFAVFSESLQAIYESLQDDHSKEIFIAKVNYFFTEDLHYWHDMIESAILFSSESKKRFKNNLVLISDFINMPDYNEKDVVLYGAEGNLDLVFPVLKRLKIKICAICDSDVSKQGVTVHGYKIISPEQLLQEYRFCYVMVTSWFGEKDIFHFLLNAEIQIDRIILFANTAEMYFGPDFITPLENEYYLDIGLFTMDTIDQFIRFCNFGGVSYKKILAFEPDPICYEKCVKELKTKGYRDVDIINKGVYSKSGKIGFDSNNKGTAKIDDNSNNIIETIAIDDLAFDVPVTFIKMDIEGAELEALKGAATTIRNFKPRLAISIYHKAEDIIDILSYIKHLVPEYRFWIRQYSFFGGETVLYCVK